MSAPRAALRFTRRYAASIEEVWAALTEPESTARWLGAPGGVEAKVRTVQPGRVLELDWARVGEPDSLVRVELKAEGSGTVLVLDHSRLDARVCMGYLAFWERRIEHLREAIER